MAQVDNSLVTYQVPYSLGQNFGAIFEEIDNNLAEYGIDEYTIRVSTLEEVFIEIGRKENARIEDKNNQLLQ